MFKIAGVGPGNPKYLSIEVLEEIKKSKYTLAFKRVKESLKELDPNIIEVKKVSEILDHPGGEKEVLLLASGDPNFYGIVEYLKRKGLVIEKVLPGMSSFQYLMASLQKSWVGATFLSLHGRVDSLTKDSLGELTIILTDSKFTPSYISKTLNQLGIKGKMYIGFNLSHSDEVIISKNIGQEIDDISSLAVVVVEREMD